MSMFTSPHLLDSHRWAGMRAGLLGGSFNPPHEGHLHISLAALKGLQLDCIWWLVTPQNPLKTARPLPFEKRMQMCRELVAHPKILVSGLEAETGTNITYDTVRRIRQRFPRTDFAWISGMDNAHSLHLWQHWKELLGEICMVHLTRSPAKTLVKSCPVRMYGRQRHVFIDKAGRFPLDSDTTYWMMQKKMVNVSSTQIREKMLLNEAVR